MLPSLLKRMVIYGEFLTFRISESSASIDINDHIGFKFFELYYRAGSAGHV